MTEPPHERLHWTGRFADPAAEAAYRQARFADDRATARLLLLVGLAVVGAFLPMDLLADPAGPHWDVFAVRLAATGWTLFWRWRVGRADTPRRLTVGVGLWLGFALAANLLIQGLLPFAPVRVILVFASSVALAYSFSLPLGWRLATGLTLTAGYLWVDATRLGPPLGDPGGTAGTAAGGLVANLFGAVLARRSLAVDRRHFAATAALAAARQEVHTLRGLLPICSFCKKIRDDAGDWQRLEAYIQTRTDARFSHGVCPTCLEAEYGLTPAALRKRAGG